MPKLFVHPDLPNYFLPAEEVVAGSSPRSFVPEYEDGKVIYFPNLNTNIDFDFWAGLDTDLYPALKKMPHSPNMSDLSDVEDLAKRLKKREVPTQLIGIICDNMVKIYNLLLPIYSKVFSDYEFERTNVVWRLNTIMAENLHLDTPADPSPHHFARMFVNLDNQPRIWQTSWPIDHVEGIMKGKVPSDIIRDSSANDLWAYLNKSVFGKSSKEWWDNQPRHVAFFAPGDVWIVDSRQISHQIFYGRRAVSIDFFIDPSKMLHPERYYLSIAERFRAENALA